MGEISFSNHISMLNYISAVSGGQLTLFKVIAFFKFIFCGTYPTVFFSELTF